MIVNFKVEFCPPHENIHLYRSSFFNVASTNLIIELRRQQRKIEEALNDLMEQQKKRIDERYTSLVNEENKIYDEIHKC